MSKQQKTFVLSDGTNINSKGYKIDISGMDIARFEANPVMLYEHNPERVLGRWVNIQKGLNQLTAVPEFDMEDEEAMKISGKVERGFLNGASIGVIVRDVQEVDGVDVVTRSELFEASIVSVPADAKAVRLYNDKLECLSLSQLKANLNRQKADKNDYKAFYEQICEVLELNKETDIKTVLGKIKRLLKTDGENEIEEALNLDILTVSEAKLYTRMFRSGQTDVLRVIKEKKAEHIENQNKKLIDLYNQNNDKIITYLSITGWNELKKLGYETAKNIVESLPERIYLSKMTENGNQLHDLDWYRKHNPKALKDNPELYQSLLKSYKKNK